jgi:hypothetical protein
MNATAGALSRRSGEKEDESKIFANVQNFDNKEEQKIERNFLKPKSWKTTSDLSDTLPTTFRLMFVLTGH